MNKITEIVRYKMRNTDEKELLKWAYVENTDLYWTSLKLAALY